MAKFFVDAQELKVWKNKLGQINECNKGRCDVRIKVRQTW